MRKARAVFVSMIAVIGILFANPCVLANEAYYVTADDLLSIISAINYNPDKYERYMDYKRLKPELTNAEVVTYVNIGLDRPFYSEVEKVVNYSSLIVLCNKYNVLPSDYVPEGYNENDTHILRLREEAQSSFDLMRKKAQDDGISIFVVSGYRSYSTQKAIYETYKRNDPKGVDNYSARPGSSEHQTGLAADINTSSSKARFENSREYKWLLENAYKYGFILRYPKGKEHITGYMFEPWHWRYVGEDAAMIIKESGLTFDELCAQLSAEEEN